MTYLKFEVIGHLQEHFTDRETTILQMAILNIAAVTNVLIFETGIMLNPPDEGAIGITLSCEWEVERAKEKEFCEAFICKINTFFQMSNLNLHMDLVNNRYIS
ncbi:hypothetical protein LZ480_05475 [Solibacillus sp. MA9]|uniref:Uncharacterized protein n=1 Tax=Solibacillus palustris TaxID=2908203 RepID=A0ABS9UAH4_9BACL|nr:hypothetical protein [Solibacillus sp. MA9]MCH7321337.1 hypothetical protein [Solibacillus sp. MA9]